MRSEAFSRKTLVLEGRIVVCEEVGFWEKMDLIAEANLISMDYKKVYEKKAVVRVCGLPEETMGVLCKLEIGEIVDFEEVRVKRLSRNFYDCEGFMFLKEAMDLPTVKIEEEEIEEDMGLGM